jgi:hypothetical protein
MLPDERDVKTEEQANDYFAKIAGMSSRDAELSGLSEGVSMGIFLGKKVIFDVSVAKKAKWGGDQLTERQRDERNYAVTMIFSLRKDVSRP